MVKARELDFGQILNYLNAFKISSDKKKQTKKKTDHEMFRITLIVKYLIFLMFQTFSNRNLYVYKYIFTKPKYMTKCKDIRKANKKANSSTPTLNSTAGPQKTVVEKDDTIAVDKTVIHDLDETITGKKGWSANQHPLRH